MQPLNRRSISLSSQTNSLLTCNMNGDNMQNLKICSNSMKSIINYHHPHRHDIVPPSAVNVNYLTNNVNEEEEEEFANDILFNVELHRVYIFDFDDTIFPTSILKKNKKIWKHTNKENINKYKQCKTLYFTIKNCVDFVLNLYDKLILKYGENNIHFIIITNATKEWINDVKSENNEYSSLIGELIIKLENMINIISAKDEFKQKYDDWYSEYSYLAKCDAIKKYLNDINLKNDAVPIIYCVGDGDAEFHGSKRALDELYDDVDDDKREFYLLNRIKLRSNTKSKNHTFKSLKKFENTLKNVDEYLFESEESIKDKLYKLSEDDEDEEESYIIDYEL